jgi:hypothetical protein
MTHARNSGRRSRPVARAAPDGAPLPRPRRRANGKPPAGETQPGEVAREREPDAPARIVHGRNSEPPLEWDPWPLPDFKRGNHTDEQWASIVADRQYQRELFGIIRALYQRVATNRGMPARCSRGPCRRNRRCSGRRPFPGDHSVGALLPPCVPMDDEHFFGMRDEARPLVAGYPDLCGEGT